MSEHQLRFQALSEDQPGDVWAGLFRGFWGTYREWFLREGEGTRPRLSTCRQKLKQHMPELVPTWETLTHLSGGGDRVARMLSLYCPPPYLSGCSQAVWTRDTPLLVRNYDYHPQACEGVILRSTWTGTRVVASLDCLWGVLDGINEYGLCVALAFGGRQVVGQGFGIPLVLRYVLETCRTTDEAKSALMRIPSHMAYSVSVLDSSGEHAVVQVSPDRRAVAVPATVATNHQQRVEWARHGQFTQSALRARTLEARGRDRAVDRVAFVDGFLEPPLYRNEYRRSFGTLYTAAYEPTTRSVEYIWPTHRWRQALDAFDVGEYLATYLDPR